MSSVNVKNTTFIIGLLFFCVWAPVWASPKITVEVVAEKQIIIQKDGKSVTQRVPAKDIQPGEVIFYTLKYSNSGDAAARDVVINDPIPDKTVYVAGSVTGPDPLFSIDGGKHFNRPSLLTYTITNARGRQEKKVASPDRYTHIRWVIKEIAPGQTGQVGFQVRVQ
ncbi:MAG: DUF11 domain-containing protein [Gammaproteobacteria bacterium]|nr:MAG: DUF11 domain-containing protein [Gammaproteobacteria bacterium]